MHSITRYVYSLFVYLTITSSALCAKAPPSNRQSFGLDLCTWEQECVFELVSALGELSMPNLILNSIYYNRLGDRIRHVHPMHFIAFVQADPHLNQCMHEVYDNFLKWPCFLSEWGQKMSRERKRGSVQRQLPAFAEFVNRDYTLLEECVAKEDWSRFLQIVIDIPSR